MIDFRRQPAGPVTILQQRIRERLDLLRRNPREASLAAGLGPDAIRTILSGRSKSPRGDTLAALARELQCDVNYLLGATDRVWPTDKFEVVESGIAKGIRKLKCEDELSEAWVNHSSWIDLNDADFTYIGYETDIFSIPDFLPGFQYLLHLTDHHASSIFPQGSFLHCLASYNTEHELYDKDVVILDRQRIGQNGEIMVQRTVRRYRLFGDTIVLQSLALHSDVGDEITMPSGYRPSPRPEIFPHLKEAMNISAVVLRGITPVRAPPLIRAAIADA